MAKRIVVQPGDRFGKLTVNYELPVQYYPGAKGKTGAYRKFHLTCDCGKPVKASLGHLRSGHTASCGCDRGTHRMSRTAEYSIWKQMRSRCQNPKDENYYLYGDKGVTVCKRWESFENFIADMGARPSKEHSIDRHPDRNGNYEPGNCRWATRQEQQYNLRSNREFHFNGETRCLAEWAKIAGKHPSSLYKQKTDNELRKILTRWLGRNHM